MRFGLGVVIAGGLVFAACSSGGDAEPDESRPPPTAGTVASTTDAPPTDPTTTVAASTTDPAPPTTEQSIDDLIAEIEADLNEGEQALLTALGAPDSPESEELVRRYFAGDSLNSVMSILSGLRENGYVGRPNPEVPSALVVRDVVESAADMATILVCRVDAGVIVDPLPGGGEAVVNDEVTTVVSRSQVTRLNGIWVLSTGTRVEDLPGAQTCD